MANTKISALAELAATPASNDLYLVVDVDDTTLAATGTNKYIQAGRIVHQDLNGNITNSGTVSFMNRVGIGTVTPSRQLVVVGTDLVSQFITTSSTGDIRLGFGQVATNRATMGYDNTDKVAYISSWYGDVVLRASSNAGANSPTEYVRIKAGGNVGIGTVAPTAKLDVAGTVQMDALRLDQTPTSGTFTNTHYITVNLNGTNYRIPCAV